MTKTYLMMNLVEKMQSPDQDHRFMGLTDLMTEIKQDPNNFNGDEGVETRVLQHVLKLVEDKISEVKNQAVKCLGALIKIVRESQMEYIIDKLIDFSGSKDEELRDIAGLALKTITAELPQDSNLAPNACEKLTPKLLNQLQNAATPPETLIETLSILTILISRFPTFVSTQAMQPLVIEVMMPLLNHPRPAVRKRVVVTLSQFLQTMPQELFDEVYKSTITPGLSGSHGLEGEKTIVQLVSTVARHSPQKISPVLGSIVPVILASASKEDEDLKDLALQALESLVLRCATDITPFLGQIVEVGAQLIKYDPNFAGGDEDDEDTEMADAEDEEDEDADLDEYSDDEDTSYKVRRSATKLLASIIETRPELLSPLYKEVSPVLISRFGDREETVKLEVWTTYIALLNQTRLYGGAPQSAVIDSPGVGGKRKRDEDEGMDVEETPYSLLKNQVPSLAKALLNQLKGPKTPSTVIQAGFNLLLTLLSVSPGCLSGQVHQITSIANFVLLETPATSNSILHTSCLSFLSLFFAVHSPPIFSNSLATLTPGLLHSLKERHPRVVSETFRVFSSLLNAVRPTKSCSWVDDVYNECVARLKSPETDGEVRERAEECLGDIWVCATDIAKSKDGREWDALCRTTGRMDGAIKVVTRVAREVEVTDKWINGSIDWTLSVLRKSGRTGKSDAFTCLDALLRRYKDGIPDELITSITPQLKPYLSTNDVSLLSQALQLLTLLLQLSPLTTFPVIEAEFLSTINNIAYSTLISGTTLESLLGFYAALVDADSQIATHIIPNLVIQFEKTNTAETSATNVAKCIGQIVHSEQSVAAGTIAEFSKVLKKGGKQKDTSVMLSLLVLGEIGRFINFAHQRDIFQTAIDYFGAANEDIRSAAAFAVGNIAVGNLHLFLPAIVKLIQTDQEKRLLALHAVKEVVSNSLSGQLEGVAEIIWVPLFQDTASAEESTRNVAAACLGRLTTTNPSRYLPQLQARIRDPDPAVRATVIATIRYTFADATHSYDDLLSALVVDFLSSMTDEDLTVRRLALSALNSAARNKPQLIREHLATLLPNLYNETVKNPALVRTVQMGPWTHVVDDGLEARKTAYETMYTLLDTCLSKLDLHEFISRVVLGLSDSSDEIKVICHMMLFRLSQVAPTSVIQRLEEVTIRLETTMKGPAVTKDTVKQDLERTAELQRSVLRAVAAIHKVNTPGNVPRFDALVDEIQRGTWAIEFKELTTS